LVRSGLVWIGLVWSGLVVLKREGELSFAAAADDQARSERKASDLGADQRRLLLL